LFRIADEWKPENGHGGKLPNSHQTKFHCSIANTIFFSILTHYVMKLRLVNREYIIKTNVEKIKCISYKYLSHAFVWALTKLLSKLVQNPK